MALGSSLSPVGQSFNHDNLPMTLGVWVPSATVILSLFARTGLKNGGLVQTFNWNRVSAKTEKKNTFKKNVASSTSIKQADSVRSLQMLGAGPQETDTDGICLGHLEGPAIGSESRTMLDRGSKPTKTLTKLVFGNTRMSPAYLKMQFLAMVRMEMVAYISFSFTKDTWDSLPLLLSLVLALNSCSF